jgi:hypothetical protein
MVRLVFRPYTQLKRSICTSESLQTSTRVSPGFVLAGHRSPSFGSQRVSSRCVRPGRTEARPSRGRPGNAPHGARHAHGSSLAPTQGLYFHFATGFRQPLRLAYMLDSLVRVSRRAEKARILLVADFRPPLTKTAPRAGTGAGEPGPRGPSLYRQQGTLSSPNRTARPVTAARAPTRPAGSLRHDARAGILSSVGQHTVGRTRMRWPGRERANRPRPGQLAHPQPASRQRAWDNEAHRTGTAREQHVQSIATSY